MNPDLPGEPEDWSSSATEKPGSWWPVWSEWLAKYKGGERAAPTSTGNVQYKPVEPAPGSYVRQRLH
jgi:polyhydroxyalkanoate synthase